MKYFDVALRAHPLSLPEIFDVFFISVTCLPSCIFAIDAINIPKPRSILKRANGLAARQRCDGGTHGQASIMPAIGDRQHAEYSPEATADVAGFLKPKASFCKLTRIAIKSFRDIRQICRRYAVSAGAAYG